MREFEEMSPFTQEILTKGMALSLQLGFTAAGRVYNKVTDEMIAKLRESNLKAGFVANYFYNIDRAANFVKMNLAKHTKDPVITPLEAEKLIAEKYAEYTLAH